MTTFELLKQLEDIKHKNKEYDCPNHWGICKYCLLMPLTTIEIDESNAYQEAFIPLRDEE